MNVTAAFPVTHASQVAEPRRVVQRLASHLQFPEDRAGRAALVVSELATNLAKHAREGEVLLRPLTDSQGERSGIEIVALDKGPGMPDPERSRRDGYSTTGTLGHGLGAIARQSDALDVYSQPSGTAISAVLWRTPRAATIGRLPLEVGAVHVSKPGELVCGDAWDWRLREGRLSIFVADGLGHGIPAHEAADAAVRAFGAIHEASPSRVIADVHAALRATRGAAVAHLAVDLERGIAQYAGLGNISSTVLLPGGRRQTMVSHNGTAGRSVARIQEFTYPVPRGATLVLFSDGLATHWDLAPYPQVERHAPSLTAGVLYRDFSRRRDDVTVIVVREGTPVTDRR